MDLGLKLCTMNIYIYIYVWKAMERKLWTLPKGGGPKGPDRVDHFSSNFFSGVFFGRAASAG
jgi:hypothetical protein